MAMIRCLYCQEPIAGIQYPQDASTLIVVAHKACHVQVTTPKACPTCQHPLTLPTFMHIRPEGYVCEACRIYYSGDLQAIARIL